MTRHGLVDADTIVYSAGFASESKIYCAVDPHTGLVVEDLGESAREAKERLPDGLEIGHYTIPHSYEAALGNAKQLLDHIVNSAGVESYELFLTDSASNFRLEVDPNYKANRSSLPKPFHMENIRKWLLKKGAILCEGYEADDALAMRREDGLIISIDKDLDTVPCERFSWQTHNKPEERYVVTEDEARHNFWIQTLVGDVADNVIGVKGIGPKKAEKLLEDCETDKEYYETVLEMYDSEERLIKNCNLLYLLRHENDKFEVPK